MLVPAVLQGLVGVLHIRFSPLWLPTCKAVGMALQSAQPATWPLLLAHLDATQREFLRNSGGGSSSNSAPNARAGRWGGRGKGRRPPPRRQQEQEGERAALALPACLGASLHLLLTGGGTGAASCPAPRDDAAPAQDPMC